MQHNRKRNLTIFVYLLLCFISLSFILYVSFYKNSDLSRDEQQFTKLCNSIFTKELSSDSLSLHFTLVNPSNYGISEKEIALPNFQTQKRHENYFMIENALESFRSYDANSFSLDGKRTFDIANASLQLAKEGSLYYNLEEPLSTTSGIHSQYPTLLAAYPFREKKDVETYFSILQKTPAYFSSIVNFEKEKITYGTFMSDEHLERVISQCDELAAGNNNIFTSSFGDRIEKLFNNGKITLEEKNSFIQQNQLYVDEYICKSYTKLADELSLLKGNGLSSKGLYYKPKGDDYYKYLLAKNVGTSRSISEIKEMLTRKLEEDMTSLSDLTSQITAEELSQYEDPLLSLSPNEIIEDLKVRISSAFPFTDKLEYGYEIYNVNPSLEKYSAPAFYFTAPIDALDENNIYINNGSTKKGIDLYTTLAHEGFPGHLFQTVYTNSYFNNHDISPLRNILYYGGFVEGYASYAELMSYDYAKEYAKEHLNATSYASCEKVYDLVCLDRSLNLCVYSLLDIMIHYEGKDVTMITPFLNNMGINDDTAIQQIYDYILEEPTNYLKYYVGYLEILELKQLAIANWGDTYTDMLFHTFLLEVGPADFSLLREYVIDYLKEKTPESENVSDSGVFLVYF